MRERVSRSRAMVGLGLKLLGETRVGAVRIGVERLGETRVGAVRIGVERLGEMRVDVDRGTVERLGEMYLDVERLGVERVTVERLGEMRVGVERVYVERLGVERVYVERLGVERVYVERLGVERVYVERLGVERLPLETRLDELPERLARVELERDRLRLAASASATPNGTYSPAKATAPAMNHAIFFMIAPPRKKSLSYTSKYMAKRPALSTIIDQRTRPFHDIVAFLMFPARHEYRRSLFRLQDNFPKAMGKTVDIVKASEKRDMEKSRFSVTLPAGPANVVHW